MDKGEGVAWVHSVAQEEERNEVLPHTRHVSNNNAFGNARTIKLNRPTKLNSFTPTMFREVVECLRYLNDHPDTIFTVITGEGRFYSAGVEVTGVANETSQQPKSGIDLKLQRLSGGSLTIEMMR